MSLSHISMISVATSWNPGFALPYSGVGMSTSGDGYAAVPNAVIDVESGIISLQVFLGNWGNVGIAITNHQFLMVYTTHLW